MEISGGINNPVNLYTTSTGNNLNLAVENENKIYGSNIFSSEYTMKEAAKSASVPIRKKKKNRRLNTLDTDFLPDEDVENTTQENNQNFFVPKKKNSVFSGLKKAGEYLLISIPLVNIFYLKHKEKKIQQTVETLNNLMQNADDLMNTALPYGEEVGIYNDIAKNLTDAANIVGKANKEF